MSESRDRLVEALVSWTGIDLQRGSRGPAIDHFLENRTRALGVSAEEYVASLTGPDHPEVKELVEAVTVGHTWFYRDPEQLELISRVIGVELRREQPVNLWVAGCATGEDAYTLAMLAERDGWRATIVGTDINGGFLERARAAHYGEWALRSLPPELRRQMKKEAGGAYSVGGSARATVRFQQHNLLEPPIAPAAGAWHIILCRNVLIYFRPAQTRRTIESLGRALAPQGWLFLGASDLVPGQVRGVLQTPLQGRSGLRRESGAWRRALPHPPSAPSAASRAPASAIQTPPAPASPPATPAPLAPPLPSRPSKPPSGRSPPAPPQTQDIPLSRGLAALEAGRPQQALVELIKALELDPLQGEAHLFTGIAYHLAGDPASAVQALRAAVLLEPDLWLASFYLALNYEKLGRPADAQREFRNVAEALSQPSLARRSTLLSDKLAVWEKDIAGFARSRTQ
jgi:chemotaxis protein methyltransferase CheR